MIWWNLPHALGRWTARLEAMQKCDTVEQLVGSHGPPSRKVPGGSFEIWHYPLGTLDRMRYAIHAAVDGGRVAQLYMHVVPAEGSRPPSRTRFFETLARLSSRLRPGSSPRAPVSRPVGWSSMAALLEDLEAVGDAHPELYDTHVRERVWAAADACLIKQTAGADVPGDLGMFTPEGNQRLRAALAGNLRRLREVFAGLGLETEHERRMSFLNPQLRSERGRHVDDFFGHP